MPATARLSLRTWLVLLALAIALPLLGFAGATLAWMTGMHHAARTQDQADRARALAFAVGGEVRAWRAALLALAETPELRQGRFDAFEVAARGVAARHAGWVVVNDRQGTQHLNTLRGAGEPLPRTTAGEMIEAVFRDGSPLTDLVFGAVARRHILSNSVPVFDGGEVRYCLSLNFGPERLTRLLQAQPLPVSWVALLVNAESRVVARSRDAETWVAQLAPAWVREAAATGDSGMVIRVLLDGTLARAAFRRLQEAPWVLVLAVPAAEVEAASRPVIVFVLVGLGLVAAAAGGARYVGRAIAGPVSSLAQAGPAMLRGEASRTEGSRIQEVQELRAAMAEAAEKVRAYYREHEEAAVAAAAAVVVRESEERIREILESIQDPFFAVDADWRLTYVTQRAAEVWGRPRGELLGKPLWAVFPHAPDSYAYAELQRAMRERSVVRFEAVSPLLQRWIECHAYPTGDAGLSVYFRDISGRKNAEERIRQLHANLAERNAELDAERQRWQGLVQSMADAVWACDAQGKTSPVNPVAAASEGLDGQGTEILTLEGRRRPPGEAPLLCGLRGEVVRGEEVLRHLATGEVRYRQFSAAPTRDARGRITGAVAIVRDITELKQVEEQLRQAVADKETLLREVHHRVKNNLQMLCDLLFLQAETLDDREAKGALEDAYGRVFAIARLHEQLYQSMQHGRIRLADYLTRLAGGFASLYPAVPVHIDAPPDVHLDVDRAIHTGLIVNELVTNALKHAFGPGVRGEIRVRVRGLDGRLELQVQDNGRGLPANFSVEETRSLGLRIVHILARRLGATVRIETGGGATFTVEFPLEAEEWNTPYPPRPC